ncbi:MAG: putative endonuclease [Parcubacteria group bacterium LiPW_39]|nr:MAG: putative endonuclease [Parcubacteria group bacterium LiPW_39]
MPSEKRQFGDMGEERAVKFLEQKGYCVLDRNYRLKWGEIDIVAAKTSLLLGKIKEIIFVEVKAIDGFGSDGDLSLAAQNVHWRKQQRLIRAAKTYLAQKKISPEIPWRIDVMLVVFNPASGLAKIEHLENAVWGK